MTQNLARLAAQRYLELVNAHAYDQIGTLFAEDGVALLPDGRRIEGRERLIALWRDELGAVSPESVSAASLTTEGDTCVAALLPVFPGTDDPVADMVIDVFEVDEAGDISRLVIYTRSTSS
jgi:ketosteroid isomerase-like protein